MWPRLCLSVSVGAALWLAATASTARGADLFDGKEPLSGRIRGHDETLPPEVVRCVNCHGANSENGISRVAAPHLDKAWLADFHQRRGGPPSRYDQQAFCKLLRTGIDPAHILIAREMPTYNVDDADCASLWSFIIERNDAARSNGGKEASKPDEKP